MTGSARSTGTETVWAQQFRGRGRADGVYGFEDLRWTHPNPKLARSGGALCRKPHFERAGDKVQVTETDEEDYPHIITDTVGTSSNRTDYEELPAIQGRLETRACSPAEHYVDTGYMSRPNLECSQKKTLI